MLFQPSMKKHKNIYIFKNVVAKQFWLPLTSTVWKKEHLQNEILLEINVRENISHYSKINDYNGIIGVIKWARPATCDLFPKKNRKRKGVRGSWHSVLVPQFHIVWSGMEQERCWSSMQSIAQSCPQTNFKNSPVVKHVRAPKVFPNKLKWGDFNCFWVLLSVSHTILVCSALLDGLS